MLASLDFLIFMFFPKSKTPLNVMICLDYKHVGFRTWHHHSNECTKQTDDDDDDEDDEDVEDDDDVGGDGGCCSCSGLRGLGPALPMRASTARCTRWRSSPRHALKQAVTHSQGLRSWMSKKAIILNLFRHVKKTFHQTSRVQ